MHWIYLIYEFNNLSWITEINELFHDILIYWDAPVYSFREVMKVWLLNNDMLKRHLGDLALTSERGTLHNTAEWSDNKIGNIEMEELDDIKDGLRNM